jgi:endonuclease YncB( thermonuclease family)
MFKIIADGFAITGLPIISGRMATAGESTLDGDTIQTAKEGLMDIRFCGVDTPELGLMLAKHEFNYLFNVEEEKARKTPDLTYVPTEEFEEYFSNPFDMNKYPDSEAFINALGEEFVNNHLRKILNKHTAKNHKIHAEKARLELVKIVENDIRRSIKASDMFQLYIEFPYEILDRFGRFLGWVYYERDKPRKGKDSKKERVSLSYNEIMLKKGYAIPYFIWPNVSPLEESNASLSIMQSLPNAKDFRNCIESDDILTNVRDSVKNARKNGLGIFEEKDRLMLLPFELRYLIDRYTFSGVTSQSITCKKRNGSDSALDDKSSKKPLHRYVLDLSKLDNPELELPSNYYKIELENRLFVDEHFVPLFYAKGYGIQGEDWIASNKK